MVGDASWDVDDWEEAYDIPTQRDDEDDRRKTTTSTITKTTTAPQIWEEASRPAPQILITSSSGAQQRTAYRPEMKILKRDPTAITPNPSGKANAGGKDEDARQLTRSERERRYQETRNKIFGNTTISADTLRISSPSSSTTRLQSDRRSTPTPPPVQRSIRNPLGPDAGSAGFTRRNPE